MKHDRRQEIITSAMELFAKKGFRGTTTRDLATHAEINEAIIFRYFNTKEELYSAIIEHKVSEDRAARAEEFRHLANMDDDEQFFQAVGNAFLQKHETDTTFLRLLLFSALGAISFRKCLSRVWQPVIPLRITSSVASTKE